MQTSILYFDQFELDLNSYELRKSGRVIKLEKLPMELLILLAESQGQLVTREQIIQRLWGDNVFVDTRQGINTAMRKLRIALQDDSENPRLLQTVPGRGYRLLAVVSSPAAGVAKRLSLRQCLHRHLQASLRWRMLCPSRKNAGMRRRLPACLSFSSL